jgi:hypothetical protein
MTLLMVPFSPWAYSLYSLLTLTGAAVVPQSQRLGHGPVNVSTRMCIGLSGLNLLKGGGANMKYKLNDKEYHFVLTDDGGYVYEHRNGTVECLNCTAVEIVRMCLDGRPVDEIIRLLSTEYPEVECERIRQDVEVFLSEMVRKGFDMLLGPGEILTMCDRLLSLSEQYPGKIACILPFALVPPTSWM